MTYEISILNKNETWALTDLPAGKKADGCKWIYTLKLKADGSIDIYKARLVVKGYNQATGIDYEGTFSPFAKLKSFKILVSLIATYSWELHQLDIKNAFLHGDL